jgi:hypothetical protein
VNRADGNSEIEGKVAKVAASELGKERASNPWFENTDNTTDDPPSLGEAAAANTRLPGLRKFQENLKKSIDTLLRVQLKDATSPAFARSAIGRTNYGSKQKNRGKIEKSVDAFLAFR